MISLITESEILDVALYDPNNVDYIDEEYLTEEIIEDILIDYLLENFDYEYEEDLLEDLYNLNDDDIEYIIEKNIGDQIRRERAIRTTGYYSGQKYTGTDGRTRRIPSRRMVKDTRDLSIRKNEGGLNPAVDKRSVNPNAKGYGLKLTPKKPPVVPPKGDSSIGTMFNKQRALTKFANTGDERELSYKNKKGENVPLSYGKGYLYASLRDRKFSGSGSANYGRNSKISRNPYRDI